MIKSLQAFPKGLVFIPAFFYFLQMLLPPPALLKRPDYLTPPAIIKQMAMGLRVQLADSFWLRAIQDFDFCDQKLNQQECRGKSWLFQVIDLTVELDQKFLEAYFYGGLALTVLVSDYLGATQIFDKGVRQFPQEWELNYAAGYHAMVEEKNYAKAAERYLAAADHGAPTWVRLLAGRMAAQGGKTEFAEQILEQMISLSEDPKWIERLKNKLAEVQQKDR